MREQPELWDSQREKKRERGFPQKALRHSLVCSQNKGLREYQKRAGWPIPPARGRETSGQQPESEGEGQSWPQRRILHQTVSRLPVANQDFLRSWMVDILQEGHSQRSAPQRRHMAHLRQHSCSAPRKPSCWDQGDDKMHYPPGESVLTKHLGI